jgi:NAD(P)-dependent dehydrogenase (short-subunit alcohol dehydrogenase family)
MGRLQNKVAIVTGGGRGLGKVYCLRMAEEGAKVVVADILEREAEETVSEIKAKGGTAIAVKADITSESSTQHMAEETVKKFGRIDILVNNAGYYYGMGRKRFYDISSEEWDKAMLVNAKGTWLCCRAVFPYMKQQGKGKIINLSSETVFSPTKTMIHYVASKAAIIGITRVLAGELGQYGICVNAVAPGFTDTEASRTVDSIEKFDVSSVPLGRVELPEDVVGSVIFFASDDSDYVSGQTLLVDGGRRVH